MKTSILQLKPILTEFPGKSVWWCLKRYQWSPSAIRVLCDPSFFPLLWIVQDHYSPNKMIFFYCSSLGICVNQLYFTTPMSEKHSTAQCAIAPFSQQNSQRFEPNHVADLWKYRSMSLSKCCTLTDQSYQYEAPGAPLHGGRIFERKIQACRNVFLSSLNQFLVIKLG